ncbi:hypothetical protein ONE63_001880 [Megalurothrips usitatus]|uniref:CWF19-like protein 2 n=1 Tax=Megalurothrips usitatus TaxID=439358 RepID=A0AAV7XED3_9NEOP|nr:hypothetical protein ONE63_001880 [Megalurothrips usitatus]
MDVNVKVSKKKSKKEKKEKKHKKSKKHKIREASSSSSSDSEGSGNEWVEKVAETPSKPPAAAPVASTSSASQRDEWMTAPCMFACVTREQLRAAKEPNEKKKKEEAAKYMLDRPGQTGRELNPFWADNGTGLPSEKPPKPDSLSLNANTVGDQGVSWLRRALQRAKEQAAETGRSLEEVAAERWGSLGKLEELLSEAEGRKVTLSRKPDDRRQSYRRDDDRYDKMTGERGRRDGDRLNDRRHEDKKQHSDNYSRNDDRRFIRKHDDEEPSVRRHHSGEDRRDFRRADDRYSSDRRQDSDRKNGDDDSYDRYRHSSSDVKSRLGFKKPGENDEELRDYRHNQGSSSSNRSWRKKDAAPQAPVPKREEKTESVRARPKSPSPSSSSSESDAEPSTETSSVEQQPEILSDQQMNELAAKLVKAEILGNDELVLQLKKKLEVARQVRAANPKGVTAFAKPKKSENEVVILSRTDSKGFARPLQTNSAHPEPVGGRRKKEKTETHSKDGQRVRYFPDDDKYTLHDMFQKEKLTTVEDQNEMFTKLAGKDGRQEHDFDMDDIFSERAREKESDGKLEARERGRAIQEHKRKERILDGCRWCFDGKELQRHLIVAVGSKSFMCLPPYQSLTEGHCLIIPLHHSTCATHLDEDVWDEMQDFRKALVRMFAADDEDCVLFESAMYLNKFPHMVLQCVPLPREVGDMAPIYFKKAILECESEWSTNKKLVDLSKKGLRNSVPKGLPYFAVDFGNDGGFAHVIEEEKTFPTNFAQEIIGGMLELDHNVWRKPKLENFDQQRRKVLAFSKKWREFDFTKKSNTAKRLKTDDPDSSDSSS